MNTVVDNNARYWAYSNYLIALARVIDQQYSSDIDLATAIAVSPGFQHLSRASSSLDYNALSKTLRHSWFTELLLNEKMKYPELLPFAIPWSMVEAYYTVYPAIRAYFLSCGRVVETSHATTLRTICSDVANYQGRFPPPWNCVLSGNLISSPFRVTNVTQPMTLNNPLCSPYLGDPWQHYGLFLKTTRRRQIELLVFKWKKDHHRKQIPKAERLRIAQTYRPTTFFDTLYRIRSRSNYQDADSFTFCNVTTSGVAELQSAICNVVHKTMLVFELSIARLISKKEFETMVKDFSATNLGQSARSTITNRWLTIKKSF